MTSGSREHRTAISRASGPYVRSMRDGPHLVAEHHLPVAEQDSANDNVGLHALEPS